MNIFTTKSELQKAIQTLTVWENYASDDNRSQSQYQYSIMIEEKDIEISGNKFFFRGRLYIRIELAKKIIKGVVGNGIFQIKNREIFIEDFDYEIEGGLLPD